MGIFNKNKIEKNNFKASGLDAIEKESKRI